MASEGVGKIKPKKTHQPKKPYDRSTSFLGKIKDSVKDLLIPSWLVRSSDSVSESNETSKVPSNPTSQFVLPSDGYNGPQTSTASFRQTTSSDAGDISNYNDIQSHQLRMPLAASSRPGRQSLGGKPYVDEEGPAPNVNIAALEQQNVSWHAKDKESPISRLTHAFQQDASKKSVDPAQLRMSDSYLEEPVDIASNTAPSQIMMSTRGLKKHSSKSVQDTSNLWSPEGARLRKALVLPVKDKPAFNAFLVGSTSKTSTDGFGDSSFYSGKTCYGGSAARRKKSVNTSLPYQSSLPLRKQVTANKLNNSLNATTSSTAQRILETLDRMSTPLGDAKKIPQEASTNDSVISFTPSSYRRTSSIGSLRSVTRPLQLPSRGPPTSQHKTLSQAELARNRNRVAPVDRRLTGDNDSSDFIVSQDPSAVRESIRPSFPKEQQSFQGPACGSSGKLKSKKFSQHVSNKKDEDEEGPVVPNLRTDFTLPITNINPISFSAPSTNMVTSLASSIPSRVNASTLQFTFSTPIEERRPSSNNQSLNNSDQGFKFSSPIKASQAKVNAAGAEEGSKTSPEPAVGASSVLPVASYSTLVWGSTLPKPKQASPDIGGTSSSFKSYNKWSGFNSDSSAASDVSSPAGFSLIPSVSLKSGSVMDILGGKSSSLGAAAPVALTPPKGAENFMSNSKPETSASGSGAKPTTQGAGTGDLMAKFRKPAGSWDCDTCMLSNKPEAVKCIACEASKPGAKAAAPITVQSATPKPLPPQQTDDLMAKFRKPQGTWECDACMLANKPEADKCIACETPKPGGASTSNASDASNNSLSAMFKKPLGTWECETCMVQNVPTSSRCVACESPKPGLEAAGIVSKKTESSTPAVAFAAGGGFVFSSLPTSTTTNSTSGFTFGKGSTSSPNTSLPAPTGFVFGEVGSKSSASINTTTSTSSGGFKFGSTAIVSTGVRTTPQTSAASGFTFGGQNSSKTSPSNAAVPFQFGSGQDTVSGSSKSDSVSAVVEVSSSGKLNSNTNGVSFNVDNNKSSSSDFAFGGVSSGPVFSPLTNSTALAQQNATSQPAINFNFSAPKISTPSAVAPSHISAAPETNISTSAKPASGLFQFGVTPSGSLANSSTGLGMAPSLASSKTLVNGGFGAPSSTGHTDSTVARNDGVKTGMATFGGFGQNAFSSSLEGTQQGQNKRATGLEEAGAPSAKKMFNFGSNNKESAMNGGFHFGGAAQSSTQGFSGSAAAASAPVPSGGFAFGQTTRPTPAQPSGPAGGGGFQFNDATANSGFNFVQAAAAAKPAFEAPPSFKAGGLTANFNFGGVGQSSSAPFQFGGKPAESAASAAVAFTAQVPQMNGPGFGGAPGGMGAVGSFNLGVGDSGQRKVKRAMRRIKK